MPQAASWPGTPFASRRMTLHRGTAKSRFPAGMTNKKTGNGKGNGKWMCRTWLWNLEGAEALEVEGAGGEALGGVLRAEDVAEEEAGGDGREVAGVAGYEVATAVPVIGEAVGSFGVDGVAEEGAVLGGILAAVVGGDLRGGAWDAVGGLEAALQRGIERVEGGLLLRSEERRVGKERRSRRPPYH